MGGFKKYLKNVFGSVIANAQDNNVKKVVTTSNVVWYGRGEHKLSIPGVHNQFNAEAAWQAVKLLGVKKSIADKVFASYHGAWRRMEKLNLKPQISKIKSVIYSDYAHHPTEIKATLQALKEKYPHKKIICVFQPHQQDRLNRLFKEFLTAFDDADRTILYPLYKVKGRDSEGKTSADLVKVINKLNVVYADNFKKVLFLLRSDLVTDAVIVFMSAGDLDNKVKKYFSAAA